MKNRKISIVVISLLIGFVVAGDLTLLVSSVSSRGFRGGFGRRSFSRSASPSRNVWGGRQSSGLFGSKRTTGQSGYAKPSASKSTSTNKYAKPSVSKTTKSAYGKPGEVKKAAFGKKRFTPGAVSSMKKQKSAASMDAYKKQNAKFKKPASSIGSSSNSSSPIYNKANTYGNYDHRTYYSNRDAFYRNSGWAAPGYAFDSRPSFGMWDAMMWWWIIDGVTDRNRHAMAHHHANDPGYQEWRQEAEKLAGENSELKGKLAALDKNIAGLAGTPKDPSYLPVGLPATVAIATSALVAKKGERPEFRLATASRSGNYQRFGELLREKTQDIDVELKNTAGSMENLQLFVEGKIDAAIVQSDALDIFKTSIPSSLQFDQTILYKEAVQMIANKKSGIKSVKDIKPNGKHVVYVGPKGSGTDMTWKGFVRQDSRYGKIEIANASYEDAINSVIQDEKRAVMMFVSGIKSKLIQAIENEAKNGVPLRLVSVDDWDFNDAKDSYGNRIYSFADIPGRVYPTLQKGFLLSREIETIALDAILIVNSSWAQKYGPDAMDSISFGIMETQPVIATLVNGLEN